MAAGLLLSVAMAQAVLASDAAEAAGGDAGAAHDQGMSEVVTSPPAPQEPSPQAQGAVAPAEVRPETGLASWYGPGFHRRKTASGERFDMFAMTAAHRTLAFGTLICVRSQVTGRGVVVRVNDRGPFKRGRIVDLSRAAAIELGLHGLGLKPVAVMPLGGGTSTCSDESQAPAED